MSGIAWPPATLPLKGTEGIPVLQGGKIVQALVSSLPSGGGGGGGGGTVDVVSSYAALRASNFDPTQPIFLEDIYKGGMFVVGPTTRDNGGTRINDSTGKTWYRVFDDRISAAWFYNGPPDSLGNPTTLGSGPVQITATDIAANPQWIGLADDGGTGVQTAQPYPIGTYWDFVALQEWLYACAAERSAPQSTFIGSMNNDGRVHITQWLTGPHSLAVGQAITGPGVAAGTIVTAPTSDPSVYWVGANHNTGGLNITTNAGTQFRGWVEGTVLTSSGATFTGPLLQQGDEIIDPLYPPNSFFAGVLPGTVVGPQIDGPTGGGPGQQADFYIGIKQNVPSTTMTGVGGPTWNKNVFVNNIPGYCPRGIMYLNQMLILNAVGIDIMFAAKLGTGLYWYGNATGTSPVGPAIKFNTLSYGVIRNLHISDRSTGVTNYLVSTSHTPAVSGLNVQNNTYYDCIIEGTYASSSAAWAISPEGGAAQGDSQTFVACFAVGFNDGFTFGGANACNDVFFGGQTQSCPRYGCAAFGGSYSAYNLICENSVVNYYAVPQRTQVSLGGADFFANQVSSESCMVLGCRSESNVGMYDLSHESQVSNWTCGGFFSGWAPNQHWTPGTLISVANAAENYLIVQMVNDGGPGWMQSDATSTTTVLSFTPSPGWTVNQWANFGLWLLSGRNGSSNVVASNTANTITLVNPVTASGANWWKLFGSSGATAPNWGAVTHFGQFIRNATGYGVTATAGFNLFSSATTVAVGDWVMVPSGAVFPDGKGVTQAYWGVITANHPAATGFYEAAVGNTATIWGTPTNPILLGSQLNGNFITAQTSGTPGQAGTYTLLFTQTLGANFTGSVNGNQLTVTAVAGGTITAGQALGGVGISSSPAPQIVSPGASINGYIDDGTGGTTAGTVLTVTSIVNGTVVLGAPLTSSAANISANTVVLSQLSGTTGGVGTYSITPAQLSPRASFTASIATTGVMNVTAVAAGLLQVGQLVFGAGVPAGMRINSQVSGTTGGVGTYNINTPINIASEAMTSAWPLTVAGQAASFTGHIDNGASTPAAGNILTVTALASGALGVGQSINVPVTGGPAGLTTLYVINALLTGTGGTGTYVLNGSALLASTTMTANTGNGVGVYGLNTSIGSIGSEAMFTGSLAQTAPLWEVQDGYGKPVNFAVTGIDMFGYYSAGIPDVSGGNLTYMVIDFDVMWGVGGMDQCQLSNYGKVGQIGRMDNVGMPLGITTGGLQSQFIRPGESFMNQFSYRNAVTYTAPPRTGATVNTTPYVLPASLFGQANVYATVFQNTTLGLTQLGPGMIVDIDLILTPNTGGGLVVTWDTNTVRAATPTLTLGAVGQNTIVRMKWIGNSNAVSPGSSRWWVMTVQGPM